MRRKTAHHHERSRALWAGALLTLICGGSLYLATNFIKPADQLRSKAREGQSAMASKRLSGAAAGEKGGDDYLTTGSILFVPMEGNVCRERLIDNKTWRMRDKGYVVCDEAVSWNAHTKGQPYSPTSRVDAIRSGFFRSN
jgi:hypothetical protein